MNLTAAIHARLAGDGALVALLETYDGQAAVFTTDPVPGDASPPYIVSAGEVAARPFDTKNSRGRQVMRDVRCYAPAAGSVAVVEGIAERVRALLHRHRLAVEGFQTWVAEAAGPVAADDDGAYGRIVSLRLVLQEEA